MWALLLAHIIQSHPPPINLLSPCADWTWHSFWTSKGIGKRTPHSPLPSQAHPPPLALYPQSHLATAQQVLCSSTQYERDCGIHCLAGHTSMFLSCPSIDPSQFIISHCTPSIFGSTLPSLSHYILTLYFIPSIYALFHFPVSLSLWLICHFLAYH